ncbi:MAG: hypothetical protein KY467_02985 [Gemmatimonadetes bacterium]|nr:hypothetical protein [Gemmatimonadota bacterium]
MTRLRSICALAFLCCASIVHPLDAQTPAAREGAVRMFLDCSGFSCEKAFYQTEIAFVTHVRDRSDADVHVLVTPQQTGAGGTQYTVAFLGQGRFAGDTLTLRYTAEPNASDDAERTGLAQVIKLGLVRYAAQSPQAARLRVTYSAPQAAATAAARDPWDAWTFRISGNGFFNGEQQYSSRTLFGTVSASRITERWKLRLSLSGDESRSRFELDSVTEIINTRGGRSLNGLLVRSLGRHLSAGITASASRSSYLNQDLVLQVAPAVEYNVYPYSESTRRQLVLRYSAGPAAYRYEEETIFGRTEETRMQQSLIAAVDTRQPWGSINVRSEAASFLDNLKQNRLAIGGGVELNLLRGLAFNVNGSYSRLRDQLYLPAGKATEEEILLRRRQLATGFRYFGSVGLSYTFGSRFSPVVNPRFGAGGGTTVIFN